MISIVIPAQNEEGAIGEVVRAAAEVPLEKEIIVVDDGSRDGTARIAEEAGARVIRHPHAAGNGAAIKTGIRNVRGDVIVFMDGDGQHDPSRIPDLVKGLDEYDMVVGARGGDSVVTPFRRLANGIFNLLASYLTGRRIDDLTSGFRATTRDRLIPFVSLLPNTFSYTTTLTLSYIRAGYFVKYLPIRTRKRTGKSKVRPFLDGWRFIAIILVTASLQAPLRFFFPVSVLFFLAGLAYYIYTFLDERGLKELTVVLWIAAVLILLLGLLSEQIARLSLERLGGREQPPRSRGGADDDRTVS